MRIALTGGRSRLGRALAEALGRAHQVAVAPDGDLRDEAFARQVVAGADALIHLAPIVPDLTAGTSEGELLDRATRGTYVLLQAAATAGVRRVVLGSTLAMMERYPASWRVSESWQPRPDVTRLDQLAVYLAEESARQLARAGDFWVICLRLGQVVDDVATAAAQYDPRWLHLDDAVQAFERALVATPTSRQSGADGEARPGWWVFHIPGGGRHTRVPLAAAAGEGGLGYAPMRDFADVPGADDPPAPPSEAELAGDLAVLGPLERIPSRPIRNVVVFGAGGPLAAATTRLLASAYRLRLTDLRPVAEIAAEARPQSPGAPLPEILGAPHEARQVDVRDLGQVVAACEGMDAIVNCSVVRPDPVDAFLVNLIGAYNVMRAAVAHNIRRVVHTGPQLTTNVLPNDRPGGYWSDYRLPDDVPPRPGAWLYGHTKYLGQEVVRLFAEQYDLEVPALVYSIFVPGAPADPEAAGAQIVTTAWAGMSPMTVSWEDAGQAMRCALEVPTLPRPFEVFQILADLPQGKFSNEKAKRLLGWEPRDRLAHLWAQR